MITDLNEDEQKSIYFILYGSSSISLLGAGFIVLTYLLFKETRSFGTTLIFWLSLSDLLTSLSWLPWNANEQLCIMQAVSLQFFETASYFWSFSISFSLFQVFFLEKLEETTRKYFFLNHLINWGYHAFSVLLCLAFGKFGKAGAWCWIKSPQDPFRLLVYGPMVLVSLFICFTWIAIRWKMRTLQSDFKRQLNRRLSMYLLAFLTSQIPAIINRTQNFFYPEQPLFFFFMMQAIFQPAQGFLNCLVYGLNEQQLMEYYRHLFSKWGIAKCCRCCKKKKNKYYQINLKDAEQIPIFDYDYSSDEEKGHL